MDLAAFRALVEIRVRQWALAQARAQGKNLSDTRTLDWIESLIRNRVRDILPAATPRAALPGEIGISEIGDTPDVDLWIAGGVEHGLLDYDTFPPVVGYTDATLAALIVSSQGEGRPLTHYDAAAINGRTATFQAYHIAAPPSSWLDLMRLHVQAVYASNRADYSAATSGASCSITLNGIAFGCWWGGTTALMRIGRYDYVYVVFRSTTIDVYQTELSSPAELHRAWLIDAIDGDDPSLSAEQIALEEVAILSGLTTTGIYTTIYTRPGGPDAWEGSPLHYGWHFKDDYQGVEGDYDIGHLDAKVVCLGGGDPGPGIGSYTHTVTIDWDGDDWTIDDSTVTHELAGSVGTGVSLMKLDAFGDLARFGEAGTTPDGSTFPLMGRYNEAGTWEVETYSSTASGGAEEERVSNRDPCTGTGSGRSGRWSHNYSAESSLSSLSGIRVATINTTSRPGESTPYGDAGTTGTDTETQGQTWSSGAPGGGDPCGDKPDGFHPIPCGGDDNPILQYRYMELEREYLNVRGGEYSGSYSAWVTLVPARGQPGAWYVVGGEFRTSVILRDTPLRRLASRLYEGRTIERGSDPANYCYGPAWDRAAGSLGFVSNGTTTVHPALNASKITAVRSGPDGNQNVANVNGVNNTIPSGRLMPIRPGGGTYDPSQTYPGTIWDNFANPDFGTTYNPPVSFSSAEGLVCYTEEPGNPPTAALHWPSPYDGTFNAAHENWTWIGRV